MRSDFEITIFNQLDDCLNNTDTHKTIIQSIHQLSLTKPEDVRNKILIAKVFGFSTPDHGIGWNWHELS